MIMHFLSVLRRCFGEVKQFGKADFPPPVCGDRRVAGCSEAACARRSVPTATLVESGLDDRSGPPVSALSPWESPIRTFYIFCLKACFSFFSFFPHDWTDCFHDPLIWVLWKKKKKEGGFLLLNKEFERWWRSSWHAQYSVFSQVVRWHLDVH